MKHSITTIIVIFLGLSLLALAPQKSKSVPAAVPPSAKEIPSKSASPAGASINNSRPEPSALYGYVTVVDPATGRHYVGDPRSTPSERGSGLSFPVSVVFRGTNNATQTYPCIWPSGTSYYRNPPVAVWYTIPLMQDAAAGSSPFFNYRDGRIHYDPARWRFLRIEMGPVRWQEMSDAGVSTNVSVPVQPVSPIADFPDFNAAPSGPSR